MAAKLYVIPGSHPCACAEAALQIKGIEFERVDLLPVLHKAAIGRRFDAATAPALEIDGEKIVGTRKIIRRLDELKPDPPLHPSDPDLRAKVEEAEAWGDEVLQSLVRRVAWATLKRHKPSMLNFARGAKLGLPDFVMSLGTTPIAYIASRYHNASDEMVSADLAALPGHLDRVDSWVEEGVLGGEQPNAADLQIGSSLRLLLSFGDTRPLVEGRPSAVLAGLGFKPFPGSVPAGVLPASWIPARG
jgi:glutathione S-transferase